MMPTLKKNVAKFPWIQQVINLIGGQDTSNVTIYNGLSEAKRKAKALSLQALFWKGMHKIHVNIATQTLETENEGLKSKVNEYEAKYLANLCRYLLLQDYDNNQIIILTFYVG